MTTIYNKVMEQVLKESTQRFKNDLNVFALHQYQDQIIVKNNGVDTIIVFAPLAVKAYIPKTYEGFKVDYSEYKNDETVLDLDFTIDLSGL